MKLQALSVCVLGLVLGGLVQAAEPMPQLDGPYQKSFTAAWNKAAEGELPIYECTQLIGIAVKNAGEEAEGEAARQAYKACYVDSAVRYSEAFFKLRQNDQAGDDGKPIGCNMYARYLNGHVGSMVVQAGRFGFTAEELNQEILQRLNEVATSCEVKLGT